jgi:hypothetical protein
MMEVLHPEKLAADLQSFLSPSEAALADAGGVWAMRSMTRRMMYRNILDGVNVMKDRVVTTRRMSLGRERMRSTV